MKTFPSTESRKVMVLKSGVVVSDIEKGVSTLTGSGCLIVEVSSRNVRTTQKVSTIGVMSMWGDLVGNLIFGIIFLSLNDFKPKDLLLLIL
jgi:hypothetical protein